MSGEEADPSSRKRDTKDIWIAGVFNKLPFFVTVLNNFSSRLLKRKFNKYLGSFSQNNIFPYTRNLTVSPWFHYDNQPFSQFGVTKENCGSTILRREISYGKLYKISRRNLNCQNSSGENLNRKIAQYRSSKNKPVLCKRCQPKPKKIPFWRKWFYAIFGEYKETKESEICKTQCSCQNQETVKQPEIDKGKSNKGSDSTGGERSSFKSKPLCKKVCKTNMDSCKKTYNDDSDLLSCSNILKKRKREEARSKVKKSRSECDLYSSSSSNTTLSSRNLASKSSTDCTQRKLMKEQKSSHNCISESKTTQSYRNLTSKSSTDCAQRKLMKEQKVPCSTISDRKSSQSQRNQCDDHLLLTCKNLREMLGFGIPCIDKIPNKCDEHKICKIKKNDEKTNCDNDNYNDDDYDEEEEKPKRFQCKGKLGDSYDDTGLLSCKSLMKSRKKTEEPCIKQSASDIFETPKSPCDKPLPCIRQIMDESGPIPCVKQISKQLQCTDENKYRRCVPCNRSQRTDENKCRRCVPSNRPQSTYVSKYKRCVPCNRSQHTSSQYVPCKKPYSKSDSKQDFLSSSSESSASSAFKLMMTHIKNKKNCDVNETMLLNFPKEFKTFSTESPESLLNKYADIYKNNNFHVENEILSHSTTEKYPFTDTNSEKVRIDRSNQFRISKHTPSQIINTRILENINITDVKVKRGLSSRGCDCLKLRLQLELPATEDKKNRKKFDPF